jgi:hypothetical protein
VYGEKGSGLETLVGLGLHDLTVLARLIANLAQPRSSCG